MQPDLVFAHPGQPQMQVEVVLASHGPAPCPPIYTIRMRYPRIIHAEVMTHRVFSRNARSSRAVPVKTMLDEIRNTPFVPWHWGKNQSGMQAGEPLDATAVRHAIMHWNDMRNAALNGAIALTNLGLHKQISNRPLEPFMWIDTLITSTEWSNFLWLRDHEAAEPHLRDLARLVKVAIDGAEVQTLEPGKWHLPYIIADDRRALYAMISKHPECKDRVGAWQWLCKLSAARCARISYKPFDGDASNERELERYDSLVSSDRVHASPTEHQAMPDRMDPDYPNSGKWEYPNQRGNFTGYIQFRKTVPGENHTG